MVMGTALRAVSIVGRLTGIVILRMVAAPRVVIVTTVYGFSIVTATMLIISRSVPVRSLRLSTVVAVVFMHMREWSLAERRVSLHWLVRLSAVVRVNRRGLTVRAAETMPIGQVSQMGGPTSCVAARRLLIFTAVRPVRDAFRWCSLSPSSFSVVHILWMRRCTRGGTVSNDERVLID